MRRVEDPLGRGCYDMHEMIRQFAGEQLAAQPGEEAACRLAHGRYYVQWMQAQEANLFNANQITTLRLLRQEADNLRAAWQQVEKWGTPEEAPTIWAAISPNAYVSEISGPLQLHHGAADSDVPVKYSQTLNTQMQAVAGTVEYYEYPGDNHNLSVNFNIAMARSIAFFDRYLK